MACVLVVEDDYPIAAMMADELSFRGHLVDVVLNAAALGHRSGRAER